MEKEQIQQALQAISAQPKRKFSQSYDLIITLKNLDLKMHPLDFSLTLPHPQGRTLRIAAFVDQELTEQARQQCDLAIKETEFPAYDKKKVKKLAEEYDYFIAQAHLMPKIAAAFGKTLGIRGKMPNPKLGCVVTPNTNLQALVQKLRLTTRLQAKKSMHLQCMVGKESQPEEEIIANVFTTYQMVLKHLPNEEQNVKSVLLKTTMGKPVKL